MIYFKKISVPFTPFDHLPEKYYDPELHKKYMMFNKMIDPNDLGPEIHEWSKQYGLNIVEAMIFSYVPRVRGAIHIDGFHENGKLWPYCALNFTKGGKGIMEWFECDAPTKHYTSGASTPYLNYNEATCQLKASDSIETPTLVRVNVPHRATNLSNEHRYSISVRWWPAPTFEEAVALFTGNELSKNQ